MPLSLHLSPEICPLTLCPLLSVCHPVLAVVRTVPGTVVDRRTGTCRTAAWSVALFDPDQSSYRQPFYSCRRLQTPTPVPHHPKCLNTRDSGLLPFPTGRCRTLAAPVVGADVDCPPGIFGSFSCSFAVCCGPSCRPA